MDEAALKEWFKLSDETKKNIFEEISNKTGLPPAAVEKDWWVVRTLDLIFQMAVGNHTVFKGGTSLSKAWNLIDRFSEDIDLALDKKFLDIKKVENNSQVKKLREASYLFISKTFFPALKETYKKAGFDVDLKTDENVANDQDPIILEVYYKSVTEQLDYLPSRVLIEIGSRSLMEPSSQKSFCSLVGEYFPDKPFTDSIITIPTVNPERTFLEKIFLLHENFQQQQDKIKVERLSRHHYDIEKMMDTEYGKKALENKDLYNHIVEHRKIVNPLRGIDYANHTPDKINPIPPAERLEEWEKDYNQMQESMIYKESLPFDKLIGRIKELKDRINQLKF